MLPKTGSKLPKVSSPIPEAEYIRRIRESLRGELGGSRTATKTISRWTGASDRTARNWMNGIAGPSGHHLVTLMQESDAILSCVLEMGGRSDLMLALDLHSAEVALTRALGALEVCRRQRLQAAKARQKE